MSKIDIHVLLNHPTGRVWSALTDARLVSQWLSPTDLQPVVGSAFSVIGGSGTGLPEMMRGEVTSVVSRRMLVMTWRANFLHAQVAWELVPLEDGGCSLFVTVTGTGRVRGGIDAAGYRALFTEALPALLDAMASRAEQSAEAAPPESHTLTFAKDSAARTRSSAYRGRRGTGTAAVIARWPRHRVTAAVAGSVALGILVVLIATGFSLFAGSSPSAANPVPLSGSGVSGGVQPAPSATLPQPTTSAVVVMGSPLPSQSAPASAPVAVPRPSGSSPNGSTASPPPSTPAAQPLTGAYRTTEAWDGGFSGQVTLVSTGASYASWSVTITISAGADVSTSWEASYVQSGSTVTFGPQPWSAPVVPGQPLVFGFQVNESGSFTHPVSCVVTGAVCSGV